MVKETLDFYLALGPVPSPPNLKRAGFEQHLSLCQQSIPFQLIWTWSVDTSGDRRMIRVDVG